MAAEKFTTEHRAQMLDGAAVAEKIKQQVREEIERLQTAHNVRPCLAAVRVGDDPASAVYVRNKIKACEEIGIGSEHHALPATTSLAELLELVTGLNTRGEG